MFGFSINLGSRHPAHFCFLLVFAIHATGQSIAPIRDNVRYVGATSCQSSMCHGGASPSRCQFTIWSGQDLHSRAYATLVLPRSGLIGQSLHISDPAKDIRCTTCHAPFAAIPSLQLASTVDVTEGVSCEQCHNGAEAWLRGHTRYDWTYADRVHAGMRNLRDVYVRAKTCVSCHQGIDSAIIAAGHPELIFELDGQTASEPRHWTEQKSWFGPKAWLVGQLVALHELSKEVATESAPDKDSAEELNALVWLVMNVPAIDSRDLPKGSPAGLAAWSNELAKNLSARDWNSSMTFQALAKLSLVSNSFLDIHVSEREEALRAERLVLGLDRLTKEVIPKSSPGQAELAALFDAVEDRSAFNSRAFAGKLNQFAFAIRQKK